MSYKYQMLRSLHIFSLRSTSCPENLSKWTVNLLDSKKNHQNFQIPRCKSHEVTNSIPYPHKLLKYVNLLQRRHQKGKILAEESQQEMTRKKRSLYYKYYSA